MAGKFRLSIVGSALTFIFFHFFQQTPLDPTLIPATRPITIRVDTQHRYYLNSRVISLDDVPAALSERFKTRANWTVYVSGDDDASYQDVIGAIDTVRAVHGTVILLRRTR